MNAQRPRSSMRNHSLELAPCLGTAPNSISGDCHRASDPIFQHPWSLDQSARANQQPYPAASFSGRTPDSQRHHILQGDVFRTLQQPPPETSQGCVGQRVACVSLFIPNLARESVPSRGQLPKDRPRCPLVWLNLTADPDGNAKVASSRRPTLKNFEMNKQTAP